VAFGFRVGVRLTLGVGVRVGVLETVGVRVRVGVFETVGVGLIVGVLVRVGVFGVRVGVGVFETVGVRVDVAVFEATSVRVGVGVFDAASVRVVVGVFETVDVKLNVGVIVRVGVFGVRVYRLTELRLLGVPQMEDPWVVLVAQAVSLSGCPEIRSMLQKFGARLPAGHTPSFPFALSISFPLGSISFTKSPISEKGWVSE